MSRLAALLLLVLTSETFALPKFRFAEIKAYKQAEGLPPALMVTFDVMCNEAFVKIVRHEKRDSKTGKITIAVGALIEEDARIKCTGKFKELTVSAGGVYSGQDFEISIIQKQEPQLTVREH